jgi:ATP-dependent Clp protease ATP-binding subunit ClpA
VNIKKSIGSPPGYVGFEENAGLLITQIQENPYCVLLFDEVEKSHPDVSTILLQLMDNGFITGSNGKKADCRNVILILTTNAGAQESEKLKIGFGAQEKDYEDKELKKFFSPEFRNRLDAVVSFKKLGKETMVKIVGKFIDELREQVKDKGVKIKINDAAINLLIDKGFDAKMGARPLQRTIDQMIKRPLSKMILFGELKDGGQLNIGVENDNLVLTKKIKIPKITVENETESEHSNQKNQETI